MTTPMPMAGMKAATSAGRRPLALISGGSSGIGLACSATLLRRGYDIVLAARDAARLEAARATLLAAGGAPAAIHIRPLDVRDTAACEALVEEVEATLGPVSMLITSAGIARPGLFLEQPLADHREQIEVNYFGTLALCRALAPHMARRGRGHLVLIGSGAGFVGIFGYSAYAPSKFAVRGLAETLRAELAGHGIGVTLACPPDTDTPQYAAEQASKPAVTKAISAGGGLYSAEDVAERIIAGALRGHFVVTQGWGLEFLRWAHSLYAPFFLRQQARLARKAKD